MKPALLIFLIFFSAVNLPAQESPHVKMINISYKDFKINGTTFLANKDDIIKHFGKPESTFEPQYECGFLSEDVQGKKFYSLKYRHVQFTGSENDKYQLEKLILILKPT